MQGQLSIGEFICWAFRRIKMAPLIMDRGKRFPRVEPSLPIPVSDQKQQQQQQ